MARIFRLTMAVLSASAATALACGSAPNAVKSGDRFLAVHLQNAEKHSEEVAIDDDGMLVAGLVAAYCNQKFSWVYFEAPKDKIDCLDKAQEGMEYTGRVGSSYSGDGTPAALAAVKTKCGIDAQKEYDGLVKKQKETPLPCAPMAAGIVKRAAERYAEYTAETKKMKLDATPGITEAVVNEVSASNEVLQNMRKMFEGPHPTVGELKKWLPEYAKMYSRESFLVGKDVDDAQKTHERQSLAQILMSVNAELPDLAHSMCGEYLSDDLMKTLAQGQWRTAGEQKDQTPGDPNATK